MQIACFCSAKGRHAPNFPYSHKTVKFAKVFSLASFLLYSIKSVFGLDSILARIIIAFDVSLLDWFTSFS